ncbi:MAG: globin family protein [Kiloniellaceae bacterium]
MTPEQKQLLRDTWSAVGAMGDTAAALFYDRLFEIDPTVRPLFAGADMTAQRGKLLQALALVVAALDRLDSMVPALEELGRRHLTYGVRKRHYRSVGAALLWTFERGLGDAWTQEAEEAWAQAYAIVSAIMAAAAEEAATQDRPATG